MTVIKNEFELYLDVYKGDTGGFFNQRIISRYRLSHFSAGFAINRIPHATCALAAGRKIDDLEPAQAHKDGADLKLMFPAKVYMRAKGPWDGTRNLDWNLGDDRFRIIFDGYVTGVGYSKIRGKLRFTVQLIHWLSDLAFSSSLSNQSHPSNPSEIAFRGDYQPPCAQNVTASRKVLSSSDRFYVFFGRDKITDDLWGKALHPLLCCLAQEDAMRLGLCPGGPTEPPKNDQSLAALSRMETSPGDGDSDEKLPCGVPYKWGGPLALGGGLVGNALAKGISKYFSKTMADSYWNTTMWDKLIQEFGATFKFAIIPLVGRALVVPYMPGLRPVWKKAIYSDDIETIDVASFIRRPLRGVGIYAGRDLRTAPYGRQTSGLYGSMGAGGCYVPDEEAKGMLLIQRAPSWLINVAGAASDPNVTTVGSRGGSSRSATGTATTPLPVGTPESGSLRPEEDPIAAVKNSGSVYTALARWIYIAEVLRGRNGSVRTKFRLDICPGSNVEVYALGEQFVFKALGKDDLSAALVGTVQRVGIHLDAETPEAHTTFQLTNLRTSGENEDDRTSVPFHPLYPEAEPFTGAPLHEHYFFE